ncbi:MAG TPA: Gp37 family protein [Candidatus Binataceae bacterium]|nr:Gp37 family protein [Candidatus Binataceae bacterium]
MGAALDTPWQGQTFAPPQSLDIGTIESSIVAQLNTALGNQIEVAHYPDAPETYRLTHRVGAALVVYGGDDYSEVEDTAVVLQDRTLRFHIDVLMRDLGWAYGGPASGPSPGAYSVLNTILTTLTGYWIPGCRKMFPKGTQFVERDKQGGVWYYRMSFDVPTVNIEVGATPDFPLFTKGSALETGGITAIPVGFAPFTFNAQNQITLPNQNVSKVIVTSHDGTIVYLAGSDYSVDGPNGIITQIAGGNIAALATVLVSFSYGEIIGAVAGGGAAPTFPTN